ncbi:hypothetical protein EMIT0210MI2_10380 [Priestia megaterium]
MFVFGVVILLFSPFLISIRKKGGDLHNDSALFAARKAARQRMYLSYISYKPQRNSSDSYNEYIFDTRTL